jgi:uncharacterized OsmC-like protein
MRAKNSEVSARQEPLRAAYLRDPGLAISFKRVKTIAGPESGPFHGVIGAAGFPSVRWSYGIDAKLGGFDDLPNPGHVLCAALAACMDSTIRMLASHLEVGIEHLEVEVTGDVDVRGCLAMGKSVRPGFRQMQCEIRLNLDPQAAPNMRTLLLKQAEALCVTLDTLRSGVPISILSA